MKARTEPIQARMVVHRVVTFNRMYVDRPDHEAIVIDTAGGPNPNDTVTCIIGDLPGDVTAATKAIRAWARYALHQELIGDHDGLSVDQLDAAVRSYLPEEAELVIPDNHTVLTLTVSRPVTVNGYVNNKHYWVEDEAALEGLQLFASAASNYLDSATAAVLGRLPMGLEPATAPYRRSLALLSADDKTPRPVLTVILQDSEAEIVGGWAEIDAQRVEAALRDLGSAESLTARLNQSAARWLWASLAEEDTLRRFIFAFYGLEVLAGKVGKRVEQSVVDSLSRDAAVPLQDLFWPSRPDGDNPYRNATFRFALTAVYLDALNAAEDIADFKRLQKERNDLSHGQKDDQTSLPAVDAVRLLARYVRLVASADID